MPEAAEGIRMPMHGNLDDALAHLDALFQADFSTSDFLADDIAKLKIEERGNMELVVRMAEPQCCLGVRLR
jgi:hypothetical protein